MGFIVHFDATNRMPWRRSSAVVLRGPVVAPIRQPIDGEVPERSIGAVSKTVAAPYGGITVGSNPTPSATATIATRRHQPHNPR